MQYDVYKDLYIKEGYSVFEFFSIGKRGLIPKRITFIPTEYKDVYNLVLGDIDMDGEINDFSISDNGDRNKILATVIHAIDTYLNAYPDRIIFFIGSTKERTRLYRITIGLNHDRLSEKFNIFCQTEAGILPFQKNIEAISFLIRRKA
jgi:hypothetical protein